MGRFYRNLAHSNSVVEPEFHEDVQRYFLATSDFGKGLQVDINLYLMRKIKVRSNSKEYSSKAKPLELVFKDISTFDA